MTLLLNRLRLKLKILIYLKGLKNGQKLKSFFDTIKICCFDFHEIFQTKRIRIYNPSINLNTF